jgi:menaquinone-9 beta-reductase
MPESVHTNGTATSEEGYDAVVVGASLAGCTSAIMLARAGASVALVEQRPDVNAYKRVCSHYIQASAVATLERIGLLEPMLAAGGVRSRGHMWTRYGWIDPQPDSHVPAGVNLRREVLDPLIRTMAGETPGVQLMLGRTVNELVREDGKVRGVQARAVDGQTATLRAPLVVGADGRDSRVAELAGVRTKTAPHGRFVYGGYFAGPPTAHAPDASIWFLDPHMAAAFPTDEGLTLYAVMPTKDLLGDFRADPAKALVDFVAALPDAPPIRASRLVEPLVGKLDMTNVAHAVTAPGLALVGDAALAIDPLWGIGCGWAFQSAEWLADSVAPALADGDARSGASALERGLKRYRRRHAFALRGHATLIYDYAGGRKFSAPERMLFAAAARDGRLARTFEAFGTRSIGPVRMFATTLPRALLVNARHRRSARSGAGGQAAVQTRSV